MTVTVDTLQTELAEIGRQYSVEIGELEAEQDIRALQARYLGKKGRISEVMRHLGQLPSADRPKLGVDVNRVKDLIEAETKKALTRLEDLARAADLLRQIDVTLPGRPLPHGHLHLLTQVRREISSIFGELGFEVATGPQIETDWNNFEALAIPPDHPARDDSDTFYVEGGNLLRTHTSPVQIRTMLAQKPPVKVVAPGVAYRRDDDATHSPMFMQVEGLCVDAGIRVSDLKGTLMHFLKRFFGKRLALRFRASYFQFVEPGLEVDMQCAFCTGGCRLCKRTGWIELGGSGMVDPRVFENVGYDPEKVSGFAFGMGIERMAMLRHGVNDIKLYYEGDLRFLRQF
jgi:phenylalanyl-tRNA synthetase alpha chain